MSHWKIRTNLFTNNFLPYTFDGSFKVWSKFQAEDILACFIVLLPLHFLSWRKIHQKLRPPQQPWHLSADHSHLIINVTWKSNSYLLPLSICTLGASNHGHGGGNHFGCDCMEYWTCILGGGTPYSYCGIHAHDVCCFVPVNAEPVGILPTPSRSRCGKKGQDSGRDGEADMAEWPWHVSVNNNSVRLWVILDEVRHKCHLWSSNLTQCNKISTEL